MWLVVSPTSRIANKSTVESVIRVGIGPYSHPVRVREAGVMGRSEIELIEENLDVLRRTFLLCRRLRSGTGRELADDVAAVTRDLRLVGARWQDHAELGACLAVPDHQALASAIEGGAGGGALVDDSATFAVALTALARQAPFAAPTSVVDLADGLALPENAWWRPPAAAVDREGLDRGLAVYAVVHVTDEEQALEQTGLALDCGTDGVFLINHAVGIDELLDVYGTVRQRFGPHAQIGVNALGGDPVTVVRDSLERGFSKMFDALWVDNAGIDEGSVHQPDTYRELRELWDGCYFGGVAFKYQRGVDDLAAAARASAGHLDVLTTSGSGTGSAPSAAKIDALVAAAPGLPVAIASGITPENVAEVAGRAHAVLVATGISRDFEHLDPERVRALVAAAADV